MSSILLLLISTQDLTKLSNLGVGRMANEASVKATRAVVQIGSLSIDGFMLPDGSYRMSQTQAAQCIEKPEINARQYRNRRS
ncbi:MAG: hypothetical protein ACKO7W_09110 [Elainella sp.]